MGADITSTFFVTAKKIILGIIDRSLSGQMANFSDIAYTLGRYGVQIYVLWYAYTVLAGKQKSPVQDFIWNLTRLFVILMFVKNMDGWLNYTLTGIDGLKETLTGNQDAWAWLDQLWTKVQQVASHIMSKDTSTYVKTDGSIASLLTYAGGMLALCACAITFLMAEITLKVLAVTAPLFIFCLTFGFLRQMFNSWLQLIISSCFIFMFGSLALRAGTAYLNYILSKVVADISDVNLIAMGASAALGGIFMAFVIWQAKTYASQIASVGAEGAMQGAAAMGLGALGFGAVRMGAGALKHGGRAGMGFGRGLLEQKGGFGKSTGVAGKMGNLAGQSSRALVRDGVTGLAAKGYSRGKSVMEDVKKRFG